MGDWSVHPGVVHQLQQQCCLLPLSQVGAPFAEVGCCSGPERAMCVKPFTKAVPVLLLLYRTTVVNSPLDGTILYHRHKLLGNFSQQTTYLRAGGLNVLVVDWGYLAPSPCYLAAVLNTLHAGRCLAAMLQRLQRIHGGGDGGAPLDVHLVGHSLGAHISAFASNHLQDATGSRVRRITGLDPALPFFATLKSSWKLDPSDADFVDAIHTNAGVFGKIEPSGHADFYVNGGTHQPACREARNEPVCSHLMSAVYFAESVESAAGFWGLPCPSYWQHTLGWCPDGEQARKQAVLMGEHCPTGTRGVFIVETAETPPFALGNQPATTTTTVAPETAADTDYIAQS
ncbi:pancreatic lipase-related protein 2-like isoform X2 [Schistocerca piceifrons]|uniref:pancreatic lipase-related protein 2-like isoform X2 n=1 Tax=Schistocerca piceifrons TaxID=274613 RepID=UPI001F5EC8A2|nr:pancreatic lipase-related protein 2-like isoform X2 [Schistocerca piceifrons]